MALDHCYYCNSNVRKKNMRVMKFCKCPIRSICKWCAGKNKKCNEPCCWEKSQQHLIINNIPSDVRAAYNIVTFITSPFMLAFINQSIMLGSIIKYSYPYYSSLNHICKNTTDSIVISHKGFNMTINCMNVSKMDKITGMVEYTLDYHMKMILFILMLSLCKSFIIFLIRIKLDIPVDCWYDKLYLHNIDIEITKSEWSYIYYKNSNPYHFDSIAHLIVDMFVKMSINRPITYIKK